MPKYCTLSILLRIVEAFPFLSTFDYLTTLTYQRVVLDSSAHKVSAYLFPFNPIIVLFFFFFVRLLIYLNWYLVILVILPSLLRLSYSHQHKRFDFTSANIFLTDVTMFFWMKQSRSFVLSRTKWLESRNKN